MQKNEVYEVEITGMTDDGDGVGRVSGQAVFIPYTLVGELVRILIVKANKKFAYGKLLEVLRPSRHRVKAECEYFYQCGGCSLWPMDYEAELSFKQQKVQDCLTRIAKIETTVRPIFGCNSRKKYRNKAQFPVTRDGIGMYAKRSHRVIDMNHCLIQQDFQASILSVVRQWMKRYEIPAYDERTDDGMIRHIYTRTGDSGVLVCIVTRSEKLPHFEELKTKLLHAVPNITGIVQNINQKKTNVVLGDKTKTLYGNDFLIDTLGHVRFKISPLSFYQVNKEQTERLYHLAAQYADLHGTETVWDLYCGIGTIGQYMAERAGKIIGVEIVEAAVENARENVKLNRIQNAEYRCGSAEVVAPELIKNGFKPDVVILDPPRKGCETSLLQKVADSKPKRIVYISCKPSTLARDLRYLEDHGYHTMEATPVDMFPATPHVEVAVLLVRKP